MSQAETLSSNRLFRPLPDGEMAVLEFGHVDRPVDLVFQHANGFNALTYRSLLSPLAQTGGRRIWAVDLRGHGRSRLPLPPGGPPNWNLYRDDLIALLEGMDGPAPVVAGHSMGGTSALLAAARRPELISRLALLDPVIWPRRMDLVFRAPLLKTLARRAPIVASTLRRRADFPDRETALRAYRGRGAFRGWPDEALSDYLADGLAEADDGGLTLACPPWWEAANYGAQSHDPWGALARYPGPIDVVRGEIEPMTALRMSARANVHVETAPGGGHMFPLTHPQAAQAALARALGVASPSA